MMTTDQAKLLEGALAGAHAGGDSDIAVNACLQAADELDMIEQALVGNVSIHSIATALCGVQARLRAAADLCGEIELARDHGNDGAAEAHQ